MLVRPLQKGESVLSHIVFFFLFQTIQTCSLKKKKKQVPEFLSYLHASLQAGVAEAGPYPYFQNFPFWGIHASQYTVVIHFGPDSISC